jgi:hypothetical protein
MRSSPQKYLVAGALLCCAAHAHAQLRPAVLELFTSEGCSSCPPAEAYVGELARRPNVLALAFHVDYWDDLGWHDRFGLPESVQRQRVYAKALGLSSVYTPQAVIDGRADFVGSDVASIDKRLSEKRSGVALSVAVHGGEVQIDLGMQERAAPSDVILIAYLRNAVSNIARGENSGRTLTEFNIVRAIRTLGRWDGRMQQYRAALKSLPSDATDVAVLVQPSGQGPITGAGMCALR